MLLLNNLLRDYSATVTNVLTINGLNSTTTASVCVFGGISPDSTRSDITVDNINLLQNNILSVNNAITTTNVVSATILHQYLLSINNAITTPVADKILLIPYYSLPIFWKISRNSQKNKNMFDISTRFGDNYTQIAPDGLNSSKDSWAVSWANLTLAEKNIFDAAINVRGTWGIYIWTPLYEISPKKFRMVKDSYSYQAISSNSFNVSMKITQIFDFV